MRTLLSMLQAPSSKLLRLFSKLQAPSSKLLLLLLLSVPCSLLTAQTAPVIKTKSTNALTESIVIKSGTSLTVNAGATITNNGTATGFGSGGAWGTITGTLADQTDLDTALGLKLASATAATTYQPLSSTLTTLSSATAAGLALMDDANAAAQRTTLGLGDAATHTTSTGGTGAADQNKVPLFGGDGELVATSSVGAYNSDLTTIVRLDNTAGNGPGLLFANGGNTATIVFPADITGDPIFTLPTQSGAQTILTHSSSLNASNLSSGTIPDARFPATLPDASGANLTALNGGNISIGTVADARIASTIMRDSEVDDTAYDATSWNGSTAAPSKNAVRDKIETLSGGAIAKTGFATKTDTATTTSTTFTSVFSASFTPTSASNSVIITATFPAAATNGYAVFLKITRGGTDILIGDTAGSRIRCHTQYNGSSGYVTTPVFMQVKDSPATTSATTYQVEWCIESGGTAYFNRSATDANTATYGRGAASLRFDEVTP